MKPADQFGLDAMLGRWPAPDPEVRGGTSWEKRADTIVNAAMNSTNRDEALLASLVEPPALPQEPGEEMAASYQIATPLREATSVPAPPSLSRPSVIPTSGRPSFKELAARASQAGAAQAESARSSRPTGATVTPISKARSSRPSEPGREDSGVLRLADLQAQNDKKSNETRRAEDAPVVAIGSTEAAPASKSEKPSEQARPAAAAPSSRGLSGGAWGGIVIGIVGIAAAGLLYVSRQPSKPGPTADVAPTTTAQTPVATDSPKIEAPVASADPAPAPTTAPETPKDDARPLGTGTVPTQALASADPQKATEPSPSGAPNGKKPGDLLSEMEKSAGDPDKQKAPQDDGSVPASGGTSAANLPDTPSQGAAQAAVRAVIPGAKSCVAGASDVTTATVVFSSSGSVSSVSVGGWAAANGKSGCVKAALSGAHVAPFAQKSFSAPVTIRP